MYLNQTTVRKAIKVARLPFIIRPITR